MALAATCVAQNYTNFGILNSSNTMASSPNWLGSQFSSVDVNNDGIPDLVQEGFPGSYVGEPSPPFQFAVSIANGDGTFQPPVGYDAPPGFPKELPASTLNGYSAVDAGLHMAFGDFNGDGNVDIAMWGGYLTIAIYLGNGDGTFQNPWYSDISLSGNQFVNPYVRFAVADFNHDGHVDLAIAGTDPNTQTCSVYIVPGDGTGLFSKAIPVLNFSPTNTTPYPIVKSLLVGDYDSDDNADLAVATYNHTSGRLPDSGSAVHVLYGNGDFTFQDTTPILNLGGSIGSGDLNSDGYTDLFVLGSDSPQSSVQLQTYYGRGDRTFSAYDQPIPPWSYLTEFSVNYPAMADFNDDGMMDLVIGAHDLNNDFLVFFLATGTPGQFQYQTWTLASTSQGSLSGLAVGDFNGDGAPDWVEHLINDTGNYLPPLPVTTGLNTTPIGDWSNCPYPLTAKGISVCSPSGSSTSPVDFNATVHSFGSVRRLEVWVDGNKLAEQHHTWGGNAFLNFNTSSLAAGPHNGTIYSADIDNSLQRYDFNFNVGPSTCPAPPSPGVNICTPTNGSTTSGKAVQVQATATIQGTLARMEIWVDGVKKFTEADSTSLTASINLGSGVHEISVVAVNTDGTLWDQTVDAMVP